MEKKTDWTQYYNSPYKTASITRKITGQILIKTIKKYIGNTKNLSLIELGGANSAFLELLINAFRPKEYIIVDNNQAGLDKTKSRITKDNNVSVLNIDILNLDILKKDILKRGIQKQVDLVLSTGLIEHFDKTGTQKVIKAHFELLKPKGIAVMTFPTPTILYKITRYAAEVLGVWIFHDERPLLIKEVLKTAKIYGHIKEFKIIWPIFLTQGLVVFQKK
ncbi:MAG: class I SAM-dependent methyltransferase [Desulfobacula sp.]|nr:class I SAM-dependent methyltransferase [Desulfobacula sp.]